MEEQIVQNDPTSPGRKVDEETTHGDGAATEDAPTPGALGPEHSGAAVGPEVGCGPLVKFTYFPKLPVELRLKIWKEASFLPRVIDLFIMESEEEAEGLYGEEEEEEGFNEDTFFGILDSANKFETVTARTAPPILHTSHEAREEGLLHYSLEFGGDFARPESTSTGSPTSSIPRSVAII